MCPTLTPETAMIGELDSVAVLMEREEVELGLSKSTRLKLTI